MWDLLTDPLVRYYWWEKWYGDTKGIVEFLAVWVRDYTTPADAKMIGIMFVIVIALLIGWRGAEMLRQPIKGETLWYHLKRLLLLEGKEDE
jgi:hypothetical protein